MMEQTICGNCGSSVSAGAGAGYVVRSTGGAPVRRLRCPTCGVVVEATLTPSAGGKRAPCATFARFGYHRANRNLVETLDTHTRTA